MKKVIFQHINYLCFLLLYLFLSKNSKAQTKSVDLNTSLSTSNEGTFFFNTDKKNCIRLPIGYADFSKQLNIDTMLSILQNQSGNLNALKFDQLIEKKSISLPEEYDVAFPFNENTRVDQDKVSIASDFFICGAYSLHFMAVYNTVSYAEPFIEKMYLISVKDNKPVAIKRIYLHHEREMGFADYTLFYIDKKYRVSLQDYEFNEDPFKPKPIHHYQILANGKFSRYYYHNGFYKSDEEEGLIKNHSKEGKWIELKVNHCVDLEQYPEFIDRYIYLEATYKEGLPTGKWKYYKLLQEYNEETGEPIIDTRKKGPLIYTESYENGTLEKREFSGDNS